MKIKFIFLIPFLCFSWAVMAQLDKDAYEKRTFVKEGKTLDYRILFPEGFGENKRYPLLLFMHGAGERGSDNNNQLIHGSHLFLQESFRKDYPAIVVFPQCPKESYWANVDADRGSLPFQFDFKEAGEPTYAMELVMSLMDSLQNLDYTDDKRIYIGGLSMGGMGTFELVSRKPEMFAAAFAICGGAHPKRAEIISQVPMWIFHGGQDVVVLPSYSTDMVIAIRKAGGTAKYTLYKDANHGSWNNAFAEPELLPWVFSHTK